MIIAFIGIFGRVYVCAHHFFDVMVGASLGYLTSKFVFMLFKVDRAWPEYVFLLIFEELIVRVQHTSFVVVSI